MKTIKYTPDAADKLRKLKKSLRLQYGKITADEVIKAITQSIRGLADHEKKGPSVEDMFGIESDYRYIFVSHNYVFYKIETSCIRIINLYHEQENFMWQLFGIDTTPRETIDYWGE